MAFKPNATPMPRFIFYLLNLGLLTALCLQCTPSTRQHEKEITNLIAQYPHRMASLFKALDLTQLPEVSTSLQKGNQVDACLQLLTHFKSVERPWIVESMDEMSISEAQDIAYKLHHDTLFLKEASDEIPKNSQGGWIWTHTGPDQDAEFAYSLNTQSYLIALYKAWIQDKNPKHITTFDRIVTDWVLQHPLPPSGDSIYLVLAGKSNLDYRDIEEVEWRTLDTGRRLGSSWVQLFYAFLQESEFSPTAQLLMLSSIAEQADYLRKYHKSGHNWTTMEMNGLGLVGLSFPEFKAAHDWKSYALKTMSEEIQRQVYPDGLQTEISTKTQWVALRRFESLADNYIAAGEVLNDRYLERIEEMYDFLVFSLRPDGHQPLNNDSDRDNLVERLTLAAKKYQRHDWTYVLTHGKEGRQPLHPLNYTYPWAGIQINRNNWSREDDWSFFDIGPYGTGHQHRDMLHLSIHAFGKDLLVDGGRYTHKDYFSFDPTIWRGYFRSSLSHNVIIVNHQGQNEGPLRTTAALIEGQDFLHTETFDFGIGKFTHGYTNISSNITHQRAVIYLKNHQWLVIDEVESDEAQTIQALWHFAPQLTVTEKNLTTYSQSAHSSNIKIQPISENQWSVELIKGQEKPYIQGWYSGEYHHKVENTTAQYSRSLKPGKTIFAWLISAYPAEVQWEQEPRLTKGNNYYQIEFTNPADHAITLRYPINHDPTKISIK